ncbi:MAG: ATP-binding protein [Geminocystis sp.]
MAKNTPENQAKKTVNNDNYVGTLVGESTSREFRLAVTPEAIKEQDIIAVDAELNTKEENQSEKIRIWAKVQRIERINPLFPEESGHEFAFTRTNPFDTVMSLSREMVTAICQILGYESKDNPTSGKLKKLRYPPKPASNAYRPDSKDIARIVVGELEENSKNDQKNRGLDIATLSNRPEIDVKVDGHAIVTRHLAILAMTGAGKSWTARRIIEQLANKHYPIVIFDPHGDYTGLSDVDNLKDKVNRYYAQFRVFEQPADKIIAIIDSLSSKELASTQRDFFPSLFASAKSFLNNSDKKLQEREQWLLEYLVNQNISFSEDLFFLANFTEAVVKAGKNSDKNFFDKLKEWTEQDLTINKQKAGWIEPMIGRLRGTGASLKRMENISKQISNNADPLPDNLKNLVNYDKISVVSLAGYSSDIQSTIYSLVAEELFELRVRKELKYQFVMVLEEGHNFVPAKANSSAEQRSIEITKQIAQEGRKFGVGLILISQRPSRLDETTLAMCNSYIIMRMLNPADQSFVRKVIESLGEEETKMLPDLDVGEAILSGQFTSFPILVKIKEPESKGEREEKNAFDALEEEHQKSKNK